MQPDASGFGSFEPSVSKQPHGRVIPSGTGVLGTEQGYFCLGTVGNHLKDGTMTYHGTEPK